MLDALAAIVALVATVVLAKMGPNDPRTGDYRKKLTARLF